MVGTSWNMALLGLHRCLAARSSTLRLA